MATLVVKSDPRVKSVFDNYPAHVKKQMIQLRKLVLETAASIEDVGPLEETLKWGEPSYITKKGSTLRMDWKEKKPEQYAMYFKCTSRLVETFKAVYGARFSYEGNRAIVFGLEEELAKTELQECIKATLTYHLVKKLPLLGM